MINRRAVTLLRRPAGSDYLKNTPLHGGSFCFAAASRLDTAPRARDDDAGRKALQYIYRSVKAVEYYFSSAPVIFH